MVGYCLRIMAIKVNLIVRVRIMINIVALACLITFLVFNIIVPVLELGLDLFSWESIYLSIFLMVTPDLVAAKR